MELIEIGKARASKKLDMQVARKFFGFERMNVHASRTANKDWVGQGTDHFPVYAGCLLGLFGADYDAGDGLPKFSRSDTAAWKIVNSDYWTDPDSYRRWYWKFTETAIGWEIELAYRKDSLEWPFRYFLQKVKDLRVGICVIALHVADVHARRRPFARRRGA